MKRKDPQPENDFFDRASTRRRLWQLLWAMCILSVLLELALDRHGHFSFDAFFAFYGVLGFVACTAMILSAKALGYFLKADNDYYDDESS